MCPRITHKDSNECIYIVHKSSMFNFKFYLQINIFIYTVLLKKKERDFL